jgi:hypothetical protein
MIRSIARPVLASLALLAAIPVASAQEASVLSAVGKARPKVQQPELKNAPVAVRSAQGDCVKEANRRGFSVLETSNFRQASEGWSLDMQVRDVRGRTSRGSCFVETRTGDVSLYGFGWGYDDEGDDRLEFSCASTDKRYRECQLPIKGRARLVKRHSDAPCIENQSWGQRGDRVWVDRGCRAKFEVVRASGGGGGGGANNFDCRSENGRYRECEIGPGYFGRLVREYSNNRCRQDQTWGTRNGVVWVTDGCKAQFVRQRGNSGGGGGGGGNDGDRQVECRSRDGRYQECNIGRGFVGRLVQDESGGRCRRDSTWGTRDGVIWVTNGCSGRFERVRTKY